MSPVKVESVIRYLPKDSHDPELEPITTDDGRNHFILYFIHEGKLKSVPSDRNGRPLGYVEKACSDD